MNNIRKLMDVLGPWKPWYWLAGVLLIMTSFVRMLEPKVLQIAVDGVVLFFQQGGVMAEEPGPVARFFYNLLPPITLENLSSVLLSLGLTFLVIASLRGISMFIASSIAASATEKAIKRLRDRLFAQLQALPLSWHASVPTGEMVQRCTGDIDTVRRFILNDVVEVIRLTAVFAGALLMMLSVHTTYAFIAIGMVPFIVITAYLFFKKERKVWDDHEKEADKLTAIVQENLSGIRVVKAFAAEQEELEKFQKQNEVKRGMGMKHVDLHSLYWPFSDLMVNVQITVSLLAGGYFALAGQISLGEFVSFSTYSIMVTWPLRQVGQTVSRMGMAAVAMDRMSAILEAEVEENNGRLWPDGPLAGRIEFRDVWFAYPSKPEEAVLKGLSFVIEAGSYTALIGPTGSGKSTSMALLMRFYEPDKGSILLDGRDIRDYDKQFVRRRIGLVLQQPFLFSSSIRSNIAYAEPEAQEDAVSVAAADAQISGLMDRFPKGFDTVVGEKGVTLSGGQKQRVALARTLLQDPDVMVMDDTTSAVDSETEYAIQDALQNRRHRRTTVAIAHRLTTIQAVDTVVTIEDGRQSQYGSPSQLAAQEGYFKRISGLQSALEKEILSGDIQ